jgi:hypothetical protein
LAATLRSCRDLLLNGLHAWDLLTKDDLDAAPGVYIYHVEAPGIGEKIGRFALIK